MEKLIKRTDKFTESGRELFICSDGNYLTQGDDGKYYFYFGVEQTSWEAPHKYKLLDTSNEPTHKTLQGWLNSNSNFNFYVNEGDTVDDEFVQYMADCVPPRFYSSTIVQVGEAADSEPGTGFQRYATFVHKRNDQWIYEGNKVAHRSYN